MNENSLFFSSNFFFTKRGSLIQWNNLINGEEDHFMQKRKQKLDQPKKIPTRVTQNFYSLAPQGQRI